MINVFNFLKKKKKESSRELLAKELIAVANEVVLLNVNTAKHYINLNDGAFQCSLELLNGPEYVGFTDYEKASNGKWNVRLFYNNMYEQAKINSARFNVDVMYIYRAIVAEILIHEMTHVKQFEMMGAAFCEKHYDLCENEAVDLANAYGRKGLYILD